MHHIGRRRRRDQYERIIAGAVGGAAPAGLLTALSYGGQYTVNKYFRKKKKRKKRHDHNVKTTTEATPNHTMPYMRKRRFSRKRKRRGKKTNYRRKRRRNGRNYRSKKPMSRALARWKVVDLLYPDNVSTHVYNSKYDTSSTNETVILYGGSVRDCYAYDMAKQQDGPNDQIIQGFHSTSQSSYSTWAKAYSKITNIANTDCYVTPIYLFCKRSYLDSEWTTCNDLQTSNTIADVIFRGMQDRYDNTDDLLISVSGASALDRYHASVRYSKGMSWNSPRLKHIFKVVKGKTKKLGPNESKSFKITANRTKNITTPYNTDTSGGHTFAFQGGHTAIIMLMVNGQTVGTSEASDGVQNDLKIASATLDVGLEITQVHAYKSVPTARVNNQFTSTRGTITENNQEFIGDNDLDPQPQQTG